MLEVIPAGAPHESSALSVHSSNGRLLGLSTIRHQVRLTQTIDVTNFFVRRREVLERLYAVSVDRQVPVY